MTRSTAGSRRIQTAFAAAAAEGRIAFVPYVVAGYPDYDTSERAALAAIDAGADVLELGLPYSDPLADGTTLQRASGAALAAGATLNGSLRLLARICAARPHTPVLVMGYVNQFMGPIEPGVMAGRLAGTGAAGAIVADLTPDEGAPLEEAFGGHELALVYLVAPTSGQDRTAQIAGRAGGFVYCVSLTGVTGARQSLPGQLRTLVTRVKSVSPLPVAVGFGVSRPSHVRTVARAGADGVVVGSALVDALGTDGRDVDGLARTCGTLRAATTVTASGALHGQQPP
ncbi:MAG TPA: tryptophan synthase subunit alpha [Candidatus Limnocylindrales bacterium]|nr:tryptophan synthase subunit alpha [Candidatus Limnocylindrales bacterium]